MIQGICSCEHMPFLIGGMNMNDMEFIETLKEKRNACDYSQTRLAKELHISRQNLKEIENEKTRATKYRCQRLRCIPWGIHSVHDLPRRRWTRKICNTSWDIQVSQSRWICMLMLPKQERMWKCEVWLHDLQRNVQRLRAKIYGTKFSCTVYLWKEKNRQILINRDILTVQEIIKRYEKIYAVFIFKNNQFLTRNVSHIILSVSFSISFS